MLPACDGQRSTQGREMVACSGRDGAGSRALHGASVTAARGLWCQSATCIAAAARADEQAGQGVNGGPSIMLVDI